MEEVEIQVVTSMEGGCGDAFRGGRGSCGDGGRHLIKCQKD